MPANDRRFWPRPADHKHILGEVKKISIEGKYYIRALFIYEKSVKRNEIPDALPDIRGKLIGDMNDIFCTICGKSVADWHVGKDQMDALINKIIIN